MSTTSHPPEVLAASPARQNSGSPSKPRALPIRYSTFELLGSLILLFLAAPFLERMPQKDLIESVLITLVMTMAIIAVSEKKSALIVALSLAIPTLAMKWINHFSPRLLGPEIHLVTTTIFFLYVIAQLLKYIVRAPQVDQRVVCAAICGYLMLGMAWIPLYMLADDLAISGVAFQFSTPSEPDHRMHAFNALYFSFITLTTAGYGDIIPISPLARMLAMIEAITGVFYMAILVSRLVSVYSTLPPHEPKTAPAHPDAE
ncbi:potassium channel family protein [Planctopirus limnophila]|nr:potassium channel family protein [Planctopirus limnophila]